MMDTIENRLGDCEVCAASTAKYTCPKCEVKTCTLKCVNIHKRELQCDGIRDKTRFVPISKFSNLDLLSDYRLLEDVNRSVENLKKDKSKHYTRIRRDLPRHLYMLKKELASRKTTIQFLPGNFTRHKENTTLLDFKSKIVYWRIEWVFVQADNFKIIDEKCDENLKLSHLIDDYLNPIKYSNDILKYYQSVGLNGINFYLKAENKPGNKYYHLVSYLNLKENFKNKTIIEYPTIYVSFTNHTDMFETVESDEEFITNGSANPAKYVADLIKADEKDITAGKGSLMFITEYSDDLLSSDEN